MKRKQILKWIEKEAEKLPPEFYAVAHKLREETAVECLEGEKHDYIIEPPEGVEGEPKKMRVVNRVESMHRVNHKRRLMTIFDNEGFKGVEQYFNKRKFVRQDGQDRPKGEENTSVRDGEELSVAT